MMIAVALSLALQQGAALGFPQSTPPLPPPADAQVRAAEAEIQAKVLENWREELSKIRRVTSNRIVMGIISR